MDFTGGQGSQSLTLKENKKRQKEKLKRGKKKKKPHPGLEVDFFLQVLKVTGLKPEMENSYVFIECCHQLPDTKQIVKNTLFGPDKKNLFSPPVMVYQGSASWEDCPPFSFFIKLLQDLTDETGFLETPVTFTLYQMPPKFAKAKKTRSDLPAWRRRAKQYGNIVKLNLVQFLENGVVYEREYGVPELDGTTLAFQMNLAVRPNWLWFDGIGDVHQVIAQSMDDQAQMHRSASMSDLDALDTTPGTGLGSKMIAQHRRHSMALEPGSIPGLDGGATPVDATLKEVNPEQDLEAEQRWLGREAPPTVGMNGRLKVRFSLRLLAVEHLSAKHQGLEQIVQWRRGVKEENTRVTELGRVEQGPEDQLELQQRKDILPVEFECTLNRRAGQTHWDEKILDVTMKAVLDPKEGELAEPTVGEDGEIIEPKRKKKTIARAELNLAAYAGSSLEHYVTLPMVLTSVNKKKDGVQPNPVLRLTIHSQPLGTIEVAPVTGRISAKLSGNISSTSSAKRIVTKKEILLLKEGRLKAEFRITVLTVDGLRRNVRGKRIAVEYKRGKKNKKKKITNPESGFKETLETWGTSEPVEVTQSSDVCWDGTKGWVIRLPPQTLEKKDVNNQFHSKKLTFVVIMPDFFKNKKSKKPKVVGKAVLNLADYGKDGYKEYHSFPIMVAKFGQVGKIHCLIECQWTHFDGKRLVQAGDAKTKALAASAVSVPSSRILGGGAGEKKKKKPKKADGSSSSSGAGGADEDEEGEDDDILGGGGDEDDTDKEYQLHTNMDDMSETSEAGSDDMDTSLGNSDDEDDDDKDSDDDEFEKDDDELLGNEDHNNNEDDMEQVGLDENSPPIMGRIRENLPPKRERRPPTKLGEEPAGGRQAPSNFHGPEASMGVWDTFLSWFTCSSSRH